MECMFYGCGKLANLNLGNFTTENLSNVDHMFGQCVTLAKSDDSNFNKNTLEMFKIAGEGIPHDNNEGDEQGNIQDNNGEAEQGVPQNIYSPEALMLALLKMGQGFK